MPYDHDLEFNWDSYHPPTTPSPSGIFNLSREGHALLARMTPEAGEPARSWLTRVEAAVPQIRYGSSIPAHFRKKMFSAIEDRLPRTLTELWRYAPGIKIDSDEFLYEPSRFVMENLQAANHVEEIMTTRVFFGGADGFNAAIALGEDDGRAYEWSHEEGFTGLSAATMRHWMAERLAWYATNVKPFCFQHGYVSPP